MECPSGAMYWPCTSLKRYLWRVRPANYRRICWPNWGIGLLILFRPYKLRTDFIAVFGIRCRSSQLLGGLSRRNYCENRPVLDSNQHLLLANLVCYAFTATRRKLSNSRTWASLITPSHVLFFSPSLLFSNQVYAEQVEFLLKLCQADFIHNLH